MEHLAEAQGLHRQQTRLTIAVLGNPNAGKTTIFNRLTGLSQRVGNYPGVTVEKKEGFLSLALGETGPRTVRALDLPGTYSLAAHSPDEMVAVDVLLGLQSGESRPDLILDVVDASNLERNLYLFTQILDLDIPVIVVLNMTDVARRSGAEIDIEALSRRLGVPVVGTQGHRGVGIAELRRAIADTLKAAADDASTLGRSRPACPLPREIEQSAELLRRNADPLVRKARGSGLHAFEALRALVDRDGYAERRLLIEAGEAFRAELEGARSAVDRGAPLVSVEAHARYEWIREQVAGCKRQVVPPGRSWTDRIDRILTHRVLGFVVFALMMLVVFQSIFTWSRPLMEAVEGLFASAKAALETGGLLPAGTLRSLMVDGVLAGVGSVVVFLPQILILFFFIGLLEDCGYMARAAFLMDKLMSRCGLSGKSFIPLLSGFACAVPAIMAARVIENRRDRLTTILVTPLMSCSARLPVYTILIYTFIPNRPIVGSFVSLPGATLFALYALGIVLAISLAWLFKRTILRGPTPPFVLELPAYKLPSLRTVLLRLNEQAKSFLLRAGTIILAISIVVWALAYFPRSPELSEEFAARRAAVTSSVTAQGLGDEETRRLVREGIERLDAEEAGAHLRQSVFARAGRAVEPAFRPLGWDWKISMAAIASFPAREVFVSTLGTVYNMGGDADESSEVLRERLREDRNEDTGELVFSLPVALSILVFFALCCQCGATLATIRRETNSWGWAWFTFAYMTVLAYVGALIVYHVFSWIL